MKNITDIIFSTSCESNLDIETNFVYNFYIENERSINDSEIKTTSSNKKYRYIELNLTNSVNHLEYRYGWSTYFNNIMSNEEVLNEKLLEFSRLSNLMNNDEDYFFNKINNFDKEKAFFYNKTTNTNLDKKIKAYYNIKNEDNIDFILNTVSNNSKSFVNKKDLYLSSELEKNHFFPSNKEIKTLENYNFIYNKNYYDKSYINNPFRALESGIILNNFNKLFCLNNIDIPDKFITKCGFYIEKYKKYNEEYEKVACKFIYFNSSNSGNSYSFNFKDEAIKYGETYLYTVSEVYIYRSKSIDGLNLDYHLVCGYPFITEDIICTENIDPLCPNGRYF